MPRDIKGTLKGKRVIIEEIKLSVFANDMLNCNPTKSTSKLLKYMSLTRSLEKNITLQDSLAFILHTGDDNHKV